MSSNAWSKSSESSLVAEAEDNNLDDEALDARWQRWHTCSLCEQQYHGVVFCALGWACWKAYLGRPETDELRKCAMGQLANGLYAANKYEDALTVREAELSITRRFWASEHDILAVQNNLAATYYKLGHLDKALSMERDIYSGHLKLNGDSHMSTLGAGNNYAVSLIRLNRFEEAKSLLRKTTPVSQCALGENHDLTLRMMWAYGRAIYNDPGATLDDLREAVATFEETERIARRVFGGAHPLTEGIEMHLRDARAVLRARETPSPGAA